METHAGLEPVIATVKGLCPNHLDEWAILQREDSLQILCNYIAYAGWRERADRPAWCTQTGQMVHGGRSRGAHDRHAGLLYSVIPLRLRMESPSTRIE